MCAGAGDQFFMIFVIQTIALITLIASEFRMNSPTIQYEETKSSKPQFIYQPYFVLRIGHLYKMGLAINARTSNNKREAIRI